MNQNQQSQSPQIVIPGFVDAATLAKKRLIVNAWGEEKKGKSHFAFTAPGPIAFFDFDHNIEGVVEKFLKEKQIKVAPFRYTNDEKSVEAVWVAFKTAFYGALANPAIRTLIIDTGTHLWEMIRLVHFGRLSGVMSRYYEKPNNDFETLFADAKINSDKNLIITHRTGDEYIGDKKTGQVKCKGYSDIGNVVQVNVKCDREGKDGPFKLIIENCAQNPMIAGRILMQPQASFPFLAAHVFDDNPFDWR